MGTNKTVKCAVDIYRSIFKHLRRCYTLTLACKDEQKYGLTFLIVLCGTSACMNLTIILSSSKPPGKTSLTGARSYRKMKNSVMVILKISKTDDDANVLNDEKFQRLHQRHQVRNVAIAKLTIRVKMQHALQRCCQFEGPR